MQKLRDNVEAYRATILLGSLALAILIAGFYLLGKQPPKEFIIATGRQGGAYNSFAQIYQQRFAEMGYTLNIRETAGGIETIELLESGAVDAGFVQNTVIGSTPDSGLSTLAAIYYEPLWIFYRDDLDVLPTNAADLAGLRINIGEEGSATNSAVLGLLGLNGISEQNATLTNLPTDEAADRLKAGEMDVVMLFAGAQSAQVAELFTTPGVRLLPIQRVGAYTSRFKNFSEVLLPEGIFDLANDIPPEDTPMIAAQATLIAGPSLHPDLARLLLIVAAEIHQQGGLFEDLAEFPKATYVGIPMNPDAARYLESGGTLLEAYLPLWLASRLERFFLLVLPIGIILYSVLRGVPSLANAASDYRIKRRYIELRTIERTYKQYDAAQLEAAIAQLESSREGLIQENLIPTHLMSDLYDLQYHTDRVLERLQIRLARLEQ